MEWPERFYALKRGDGCAFLRAGPARRDALLQVGKALEATFEPVKTNYQILGNALPHLHVHVIPRYARDPKPEFPFPFPDEEPPPIPDAQLHADAERLRRALA